MERENKCTSFSVSSGHWDPIFQELLCPPKAAVSGEHRLGAPVGTKGDLCTLSPGTGTSGQASQGSTDLSQGKAQPCSAQRSGEPEISRENLLQSLVLSVLLHTWGKVDSLELLGMTALSPLSPCSPARDRHQSSQIHHQSSRTKPGPADDTPNSPAGAPVQQPLCPGATAPGKSPQFPTCKCLKPSKCQQLRFQDLSLLKAAESLEISLKSPKAQSLFP